jgi:4-hydroxy-3-methylbut-2-en-1-yl diphosphate reductase
MSRDRSDPASSGPLIAAPLRLEALIVRSGARNARVQVTGMGPERARTAARALRAQPGRGLLILGFCGALEPDAVPGEVVVAERISSSPDISDPSAELPVLGQSHDASVQAGEGVVCADADTLVTALGRDGLRVRRGAIVCVSRLVLGRQRAELRERSGAIAVDMESVWLAAGAGSRPVGVVRVILDSPSHELLRPRAAVGAVRAAISLRRAAAALHDWRAEV